MGLAGLSISQISDLTTNTRPKQPKNKYTQTQALTDFPLVRLFFKDNKEIIDGGAGYTVPAGGGTAFASSYEARVRLRDSAAFEWIRPFTVSANVLTQLFGLAAAPMAFFREHFLFDKLEKAMNGGEEQIVNELDGRRDGCAASIHTNLERAIARATQPLSGNTADFRGLFGILSTTSLNAASDTTGDFNGQQIVNSDNSTTASILGIDASNVDNQRWRNWCANYSGTLNVPALDTMRRGMTRTNFMALDEFKADSARAGAGKRCILMGHGNADEYEKLSNAGADWKIVGATGDVNRATQYTFRGVDIIRTPAFDEISFAPIVGVWTKHVYGLNIQGIWMNEAEPQSHMQSSTTFRVDEVSSAQMFCDDRRAGAWVLSTTR